MPECAGRNAKYDPTAVRITAAATKAALSGGMKGGRNAYHRIPENFDTRT